MLAAVFLPAAVSLGFREEKLVAVLVMLGSATTMSCYIMAKNMGHEGNADFRYGHADDAVQCVYTDGLAVSSENSGADLIRNQILT